ncbi:hypothetical protein DP112_04315 [Streptococcus suis]|nr:hypothetical protein DP112_04315 [Streptococcus suis]
MDLFIMSSKIRKRIRSSGPFYHELENTKANKVQWAFQIEEKVHFGQFSSIFFFMLKIKNSQKRRNINVYKSLITCYLSQTSSIF